MGKDNNIKWECKECGYPVICVHRNPGLVLACYPPIDASYTYYCSNKGCNRHDTKAMGPKDSIPEWVGPKSESRYSDPSWVAGKCRLCGKEVLITQPITFDCDYFWYCSNPDCPKFEGVELGDMEKDPEWVAR